MIIILFYISLKLKFEDETCNYGCITFWGTHTYTLICMLYICMYVWQRGWLVLEDEDQPIRTPFTCSTLASKNFDHTKGIHYFLWVGAKEFKYFSLSSRRFLTSTKTMVFVNAIRLRMDFYFLEWSGDPPKVLEKVLLWTICVEPIFSNLYSTRILKYHLPFVLYSRW